MFIYFEIYILNNEIFLHISNIFIEFFVVLNIFYEIYSQFRNKTCTNTDLLAAASLFHR